MPLRYDIIAADRFSSTFEKLGRWLDRTETEANQTNSALRGMEGTLASMSGVIGALGLAFGAQQLFNFGKESLYAATSVEQLRMGMERLGKTKGVDVDKILQDMEAVSAGIVDEKTLVLSINRAMRMGGKALAESLPQLTMMAREAAQEMDDSFNSMLHSIVLGIARGSPLILDNLGYIVDIGLANKQMARELGISTTALTEQQKMVGLLNQVIERYGSNLDVLTEKALTNAEKIQTLTSAWTNLKIVIGETLVEAGAPEVFANIADMLEASITSERVEQPLYDQMMRLAESLDELGRSNDAARLRLQALVLDFKTFGRFVGKDSDYVEELADEMQALIDAEGQSTEQTTAWAMAMGPVTRQTTSWARAMRELAIQTGWVHRQLRIARQDLESGMWTADEAGIDPFRQNIGGGQWTAEDWFQIGDMSLAAEDAGEEIATSFASGFNAAMAKFESDIQDAVLAGLEVKPEDFLAGYEDAPLEAVRRLRDIANRGLESPWASFFEIPPEVLAKGSDAVKRWAADLADKGAALRDISLIDKDAFLRELAELQTAAKEKAAVLAKLKNWAIEAGLSPEDAKLYAEQAVGVPSGEGAVEGLLGAFAEQDPGSGLAEKLADSVTKAKEDYQNAGKAMAEQLWIGLARWIAGKTLTIPTTLSCVPTGSSLVGTNGVLE
jgi:hypothetical protein